MEPKTVEERGVGLADDIQPGNERNPADVRTSKDSTDEEREAVIKRGVLDPMEIKAGDERNPADVAADNAVAKEEAAKNAAKKFDGDGKQIAG